MRGGGGCGLSSGKRQENEEGERWKRQSRLGLSLAALTWWSERQMSGDSFLQMVATFRLQSPVCATRLD